MVLNYIEHVVVLGSTTTGCVSISALALLVRIPIEIISPEIRSKIYRNLKT